MHWYSAHWACSAKYPLCSSKWSICTRKPDDTSISKHSTHCANRSDPCRKAAFSVRSDGAYTAAYTLRRSWTWLICKVGARTRLRTHGTFEIPLSRRHPVLSIPFWSFIVLKEANKFVYHWKLQKEKEMTRHQVSNFRKKGSSDKRCLGSMPGHKMPLLSA